MKVTRQEYESKATANRKMVYRLHKDGQTAKEIADMTGYSEAYVDHLIRKNKKPAGRRLMSDADRETVIALHRDHKTLKEIADVIGFSQSAVQKCVKNFEDAEKEKNPEPEEESFPVEMATRKPQAKVIYVNGKRYQDVSEFYLGV